MDPEAERRARRKRFQADLTLATSDEEACPPEWADLLSQIDRGSAALRDRVAAAARRFADEPDIRRALADREREDAGVREAVRKLNAQVQRLNLIAPLGRFNRSPLDPDEILRTLLRARRPQGRSLGGTTPTAPSTRGPGTPRNS